MHLLRKLGLLALLPPLIAADALPQPPSHDARIATLRHDLETVLNEFQHAAAKPGATPDTREFSYSAHYLLALHHPASEAEPLIRKAFDQQNMDPSSPAFGTVLWKIDHPEIKDANAIEFTAKPLGPIFLLYGDKLSPELKHDAVRHLQAAAAAIQHHKVGLDYTNIFLMKSANLYAIGLILHDDALTNEGLRDFHDWFKFTRTHGITEYSSPTYADTQLSCLLQTYRITPSAAFKKEIAAALDYVWTDLAANTFLNKNMVGGAQLAGSFSRTYDFPNGDGPFDRFLYAEGIRNAPCAATILVDIADPLINELENGYRPDPSVLALAHLPSRILRQNCGIQPGQDHSSYLTPNFAIGSGSSSHGQQDRQLSISLAELTPDKTIADISVVLDPFDSPYGNHKANDKSGHSKPTHLKNVAATVQENGAILSLLDLAPSLNTDLLKPPVTTLSTSILFPANVDQLLLDGKPLTLTPGQSIPVSSDSWLIVREGKAAAAVRIFTADNQDNSSPQFFIKYDGPDFHAARLVAYHLSTTQKQSLSDAPIRAGILLLACDCPTPEFARSWYTELHAATLTQSNDHDMWSATFIDGPRLLSAVLNLPRHRPERRTINSTDFQPTTFTLNGEDKTNLLPSTP